MLSDGVDNAVDLEALQAQIDLSMALTDQLVSSWLPKSATGKTNEKNGKTFDAELQDVLRRPARYVEYLMHLSHYKPTIFFPYGRLGVGAPLPESTTGTTKEILRLKSKLSGKSKRKFGGDNENSKTDHDLEDDEGRGKRRRVDYETHSLGPFQHRARKEKSENKRGR